MSAGGAGPGTHGEPLVAVIVVTYNSTNLIRDCLATLNEAFSGVPFRVVVVDNASTDSSVETATATLPGISVVQMGRNSGYAAAINAGVGECPDGDAFLVLNPDIRLRPGSVGPMVAALTGPGAGIAVPRIIGPTGALEQSLRREPTVARALGAAVLGGSRAGRFPRFGEVVTDATSYASPGTADWATGAVMLISRPCLEAVGPWDESFFLYSEETDFALRARDKGFALRFVPVATSVHLGGESNTRPDLWALLVRNRIKLYRKRHSLFSTGLYWLALLLNEAVRAVRPSPTHRAALRALLWPPAQSMPVCKAAGYICFSAQDWWYHNRGHADAQLMRRVAQTRKVLLVNSLTLRMPLPGRSPMALRRIRRKAASMAKLVRRPLDDVPNFHVMTPIIVPFYGIPWARAINAWIVRQQVQAVARAIGIEDPILVVTIPTAWEVVRGMARRTLIYNRSDRFSSFDEADQDFVAGLEDELLINSDKVLYVSHALMSGDEDRNAGRAEFLDHGVDLEHFRRRTPDREPEDLRTIPHPRIGFFGGFDDYIIDFRLLERIAREIPEAHLVLIGDATCSMQRFDDLPNVHWLGFRPYEQIPEYGSGFDVAIMPWLDNEWIRDANPIKLKEYLALGLRVVSTDFPEVHRWAEWVDIGADADDFLVKLRGALDAQPTDGCAAGAARRAVAGSSWALVADRLISLCENSATSGRQDQPTPPCAAS